MDLALFDFDGTLTTRDTLFDFLWFTFGFRRFLVGMIKVSPVLLLFAFGAVSNVDAKKKILSQFFKGLRAEELIGWGVHYGESGIPRILRLEALERLCWHKTLGHRVIVVTASAEEWVRPWCSSQDVELIGTKLEVVGDRVTGNFATSNCRGAEKVRRIRERVHLENYRRVYAYGDSKGDREMLSLATDPHYRDFGGQL